MTTHRDDGSIIEDVVLWAEDGSYGVNIPKGVWHTIEAMEADSVIFECKEGPFVEHEVDGILNLNRVEPFKKLMALIEENKRVNQYK